MSCTSSECRINASESAEVLIEDTLIDDITKSNIVRYEPVLLPYYREILGNLIEDETPAPKRNYTSYDLFCLKTKLYPFVEANYPDCDITFVDYEIGDVMRLTLELYRGGRFVSWTKDEAARATQVSHDLIEDQPGHALLLSSEVPIPGLPVDWYTTMLQYLTINNSYYHQGNIYVMLNTNDNYSAQWTALYFQARAALQNLYDSGAYPIIPELVDKLVSDWDLELVIDDDLPIYKPAWSDPRIVKHKGKFMEHLLSCHNYISMRLGDQHGINVKRHYLAKILAGSAKIDFYFSRCCVHFNVDNITDAQHTADIVEHALYTASIQGGQVTVSPTTSDSKNNVVYTVLEDGHTRYYTSILES